MNIPDFQGLAIDFIRSNKSTTPTIEIKQAMEIGFKIGLDMACEKIAKASKGLKIQMEKNFQG